MVMDWSALLEAIVTGVGAVIEAIITALSTNAASIATFVIGGLMVGAAVKFGSKVMKGVSGLVKKLF